jgi:FlaA1/EpsC-like NDP-sugar epimerase
LPAQGEIFVLDMGEQVRIMDLAETLIRLSGLKPYVDIDIKVTGMRPGEKLYEELFTPEEGVDATKHQRIFVAKPCHLDLPSWRPRWLPWKAILGKSSLGIQCLRWSLSSVSCPSFRADEDSRAGWLEAAAAKAE